MGKGRLEAFSDGVLAIIITIMVLELKVPHGDDFSALRPLAPVFCSYVLSFIYVGIYWNNHHHMLYMAKRVSGAVLWANLHLLFWLSLIPVVTGWIGDNHLAALPTALYGFVLLMASLSYAVLQYCLTSLQGPKSELAQALGRDIKGKLSSLIYLVAIGVAFVSPLCADALYVSVAAMWLVPDQRFERKLTQASTD